MAACTLAAAIFPDGVKAIDDADGKVPVIAVPTFPEVRKSTISSKVGVADPG